MNLLRRHIGRRVAGVGVGVALLVLGLEAPAFAAAPVISSFTPDSGNAAGGCVVVVTGTGLDDFSFATWEFVSGATAVTATDFVHVSDTEAWVVAPPLAAGTAFNIRVTNQGGTSTSTTTFLATTAAGACAPTITSLTPDCGLPNAQVVIAGTNLLIDAAGSNTIVGGTVQFTPFSSNAAVVPPDSDTATQLTRFVSADAADGPVKVIAGGGTAFSADSFAVPPPDCPPIGAEGHARSISLNLRKHLVARGRVSSTEDPAFTDCVAGVPVKIQRRRAGGWRTVGSTTTSDTGAYKKRIRDRAGRYRALAPKVTVDTELCLRAVSPRRTHRH
jgi:IPT/TIG domain